ncbi:hypothetical protein An08g06970 [Aspergillus niger]|uniref:Uncharacterized protein n=2 Tax=Aspergillus niger TaxID=5061 RepID=A2QRR6_ASPNC|nr:hypothetical protein An08g06970 [Aspergillus niger]CAK45667.1 hypothetical protein An08g06970 [Aspergillus niger]
MVAGMISNGRRRQIKITRLITTLKQGCKSLLHRGDRGWTPAPVSIKANGDELRGRPFDPGKHSPPETEKGHAADGLEIDRARLRWTEPAQAAEDPWAKLRTSWQEESDSGASFPLGRKFLELSFVNLPREPIVGAAGCRSSELPLRSGVNFFMTLYALTAHTREKQKVDKQRFYAQSHIGLFVVSVASRRQMIHGDAAVICTASTHALVWVMYPMSSDPRVIRGPCDCLGV